MMVSEAVNRVYISAVETTKHTKFALAFKVNSHLE